MTPRELVNSYLFGGQHEAIIKLIEDQDSELELLRERIRRAPHARHCEAGASLFPGLCNCWKGQD